MGILKKLKELIVGKYAKSFVRHLLGLLGGVLLGIGVDPEAVAAFTEASQQVIMGIILFVVAQGWSFGDKAEKD